MTEFRRRFEPHKFEDFLKESMKKDIVIEKDVKEFLLDNLKDNSNIGNQEIGAFLSLISFNKHGVVETKQIYDIIYK